MTARDVQVGVTIDGVDVLDAAIERVTINWGRESLEEQPDTATAKLTIDVTRAGWDTNALPLALGSELVVTATHTSGDVLVYRGALDEPTLYLDDATGHVHLSVTADDVLAELAAMYVGDEPWDLQTAQERADVILALIPSQFVYGASWASGSLGDLPERLWSIQERDVDRQPALTVLHQLAASTDTAIYVIPGPMVGGDPEADPPVPPNVRTNLILFHGLSLDHPGYEFADVAGVFVKQLVAASAELTLSADHLRPDVEYSRARAQLLTDAAVLYEPSPGVEAEERLTVDTPGIYRRLRVETGLALQTEALDLLERLWRRNKPTWHTDSLTWDADDGGDEANLLTLLDAASRIGLATLIADAPAWIPTEALFVYVEGGTIEYLTDRLDRTDDANPGRWVVTMNVVPSTGIGRGISYAETLANHPTMTYTNIDPGISYAAALSIGV